MWRQLYISYIAWYGYCSTHYHLKFFTTQEGSPHPHPAVIALHLKRRGGGSPRPSWFGHISTVSVRTRDLTPGCPAGTGRMLTRPGAVEIPRS